MVGLTEIIAGTVKSVVAPVAEVFSKREERKAAKQAANAALHQARENNDHEVVIKDQELEHILADGTKTSWRDEYVTVSLVGIINAVVVGGILQGFGWPDFLAGVLIGVEALSKLIDLRFAMTAAVLSSLGYSVWRKFT